MKLAAVTCVMLWAGIAHADRGPRADRAERPVPADRADRPHLRQLRQALVQRFDRDGDGKLQPRERRQAARALRRLARRLDHTAQPASRGARANRRERLIRRFDRDGDGSLGPGELPARVIERLRRLDRNDDGWLQPDELP